MHLKQLKFSASVLLVILLSGCAHSPSPSSAPASLQPVSAPNTTNKMALRIYEKLPIYVNAAKLPWPSINIKTPITFGASNAAIPEIRTRLIALGDLPVDATSQNPAYTQSLSRGISQFQKENGLRVTGVITEDTLNALNITPAARYRELVSSMNEWANYPEDASSRYIQVNIPSYDMHVEQGGQDVLHMKVIVGRPERPTPLLSSKVTTIVFNPSWNVPKTILSQDVIPGMQKNPNYLQEHYNMKIYASWDKTAAEINPATINWQTVNPSHFQYRVTAPPSDVNPLGRVKFIFANSEDIYMHDTPEKSIFDLTERARSSGCIRLQNPMGLVDYFSADNSDLTPFLIAQYLSTYDTKYIQLKNPMPIYITYILAWVDTDGHVIFAQDIYHRGNRMLIIPLL